MEHIIDFTDGSCITKSDTPGMVRWYSDPILLPDDYSVFAEQYIDNFITSHQELTVENDFRTRSLRYNEGKPDWTLVHFGSLVGMVRVLEFGAQRYSRDNWKKPTDLNTILASAQRHLADMIDGNPIDSDSGLPNHDHLLCNLLFYAYHYNQNRHPISKREESLGGLRSMEVSVETPTRIPPSEILEDTSSKVIGV